MNPRNSIAGWYFSESEIQKAVTGHRMLNPSLDLSNPCNLNCPYCFIEKEESTRKIRKPNELSIEETYASIDAFLKCGAKTITIVGAGEPTIDPHFFEIVKAISSRGMTTVLFTNGIALARDPEIVRFLNAHGTSVVLKYNSKDHHVQDMVAGRPGYAEKRDLALELLLDAGFAAYEPTRLGLDIMVFKGNLIELPQIHKYCRKNNIYPIAGDYIPTGRTDGGSFHGHAAIPKDNGKKTLGCVEGILSPPTSEERAQLFHELESIDRKLGVSRNRECAYYSGGSCTQILGLYVDISGDVWPCVARKTKSTACYIEKPLGNIRKGSSIEGIWRGNSFIDYLRRHYTGECPYKPSLSAGMHNQEKWSE